MIETADSQPIKQQAEQATDYDKCECEWHQGKSSDDLYLSYVNFSRQFACCSVDQCKSCERRMWETFKTTLVPRITQVKRDGK